MALTSKGDDEPTLTLAEAAKLVKLDKRRIQQLHKEGWIPKADRGRYPVVGLVQGVTDYYRDLLNKGSKKLDEDARLKAAQANLRELELAKQRGLVMDTETVDRLVSEVIVRMNASLDALPSRSAVDLVGKNARDIKAMLTDEIRRVQNDFSTRLASLASSFGKMVGSRERAKKKST